MIATALFVQVTLFVVVVAAFVSSRNSSMFHPLCLYLIFHFLVFVMRPLLVYGLDFNFMFRYMQFTPSDQQFVDTLMLSSVGLVVFAICVWYAGRCNIVFMSTGLPEWTQAEKRAYAIVALLLGPLAIYSGLTATAGASFENTGDVQMTRDLATGTAIYTNTTGYIAESHAMLGALCILFLWRCNFRAWAYAPFIMFIGYRAFLGWGRWSIITSVLSLALIYLYRNNRRWPRWRWFLILVPIAILFQNLGMNRDLVRDYVDSLGGPVQLQTEAPQYNDRDDPWAEFDHPDFANFDFLTFVMATVPEKTNTYTYFTQYLQLFTEPVPRIIWKEKPIGAPISLFNLNDYGNFMGMTVSLVGDGWMSFGWLGVMVTMALVAFAMGRTHRAFWRNQASPRVVMAYCIFLPLTITWYRDGGISIFKFALFTLTPILAWNFLSRMIGGLQEKRRARFRPRIPGRGP